MSKKAVLTILSCALASLGAFSCGNSEQVARERQKQAAIEAFDKKQAEDARATEGGVATKEDREKQIQRDLDADKEIANLRSPDRDVVNPAIMMVESYRACKAVPGLMHLLKESPDDYIADLSAQAISMCNERSTSDVIIGEFLRRKATPVMLDAIGKINTADPRVIEKIKKLTAERNEDMDATAQQSPDKPASDTAAKTAAAPRKAKRVWTNDNFSGRSAGSAGASAGGANVISNVTTNKVATSVAEDGPVGL